MPYQVGYDSVLDCVVTTITGDMDKQVITGFFQEVGKVAHENNCYRVLSDLRSGVIAASIADMYEMAGSLEKMSIHKSFRRAIVISRDHRDFSFWETVCYNQGHQNVKIFEDYEEAKSWVLMK